MYWELLWTIRTRLWRRKKLFCLSRNLIIVELVNNEQIRKSSGDRYCKKYSGLHTREWLGGYFRLDCQLRNDSPRKWGDKKKKKSIILSHNFWVSESMSSLTRWFELQIYHDGAIKILTRATCIWWLIWGRRTLLQDALTWQLADGFSSSPCRLHHSGCSSVLMAWQLAFPRLNKPRERERRKPHIFYDLI